ncbi:hypothetical protein Tco_1511233, partial [Tanacetum coccineum]
DSACDDSLIQATLLTLIQTNLLKLKEVTNLTVAALASLVNWFHSKFHVKSLNSGKSISLALAMAFETQIGTLEEILRSKTYQLLMGAELLSSEETTY